MKNYDIDLSGVTLVTDRLVLRPFKDSDLRDFYEYAKVKGVGEAAGWKHHEDISETRQVLKFFIDGKHTFALVEKSCGKVIGSLSTEQPSAIFTKKYGKKPFCEIGYALSMVKWGNGLMTEAVKALLGYLFNVCGLSAVGCGHFIGNDRSRRVIEKCGFTYYGSADYTTQLGTVENSVYYLLTRRQYAKLSRRKSDEKII